MVHRPRVRDLFEIALPCDDKPPSRPSGCVEDNVEPLALCHAPEVKNPILPLELETKVLRVEVIWDHKRVIKPHLCLTHEFRAVKCVHECVGFKDLKLSKGIAVTDARLDANQIPMRVGDSLVTPAERKQKEIVGALPMLNCLDGIFSVNLERVVVLVVLEKFFSPIVIPIRLPKHLIIGHGHMLRTVNGRAFVPVVDDVMP